MYEVYSRPMMKDLMKELVSVVDWQLLMINMGMEKYENDKIERNFGCDIDRQKQEAFDKWLRKKPNACWKNVIDALYEIEEITLASSLAKRYNWKDPRVYVNSSFLSASYCARITAKKSDCIPCRRFLSQPACGLEYYTFKDESVRPINEISAAARTKRFSRLIQTHPYPYSLADFFRSIENSSSKVDFKVGLEARFGHLHWKMHPRALLPPYSTNQEWISSQLLRKTTFNPQ
ncbi:uncharacterized protein LOC135336701 isoform X2 [Halichondria panicea]|uniref:uncharacterized protein LOC135336701 isoform X2 n=1 Tax=Halichondria panicea TaxID=6063 RepID=UPI00312B8463